jgi:hypothetical protein
VLESGLTISAGRKWSAQALPRFRLGEVSHQTTKKLVASRTWAREKSLSLIGFRIYCSVIPAEDMGLRHLDQRIRQSGSLADFARVPALDRCRWCNNLQREFDTGCVGDAVTQYHSLARRIERREFPAAHKHELRPQPPAPTLLQKLLNHRALAMV